VTFDEVADELYALPLGDFTATRNARAKQARDDGDRDLAERIKGLARPTVAAWLVNRLVRERPDEVTPLRELGAQLREATTTLRGDQLRTLTRRRHQLVGALVGTARRLGADAGQRVSEQAARALERTFDAALADPDAAEQVIAGRLSDTLEPDGFLLGGGEPPATAKQTAPQTAPKADAAAKRALADAEQRRDDAKAAAAAADGRLADLEAALAVARREAKQRHTELDRAERAVQKARAKLR
jgi:hypothetical protein